MLLFIPRSLCALKRVAAKTEHARFGATQGIRIALAAGLYRAEATDGRRVIIVQGMVPDEAPPWPGFKELPDDAFEAIILPKDLERACRVGENYLQNQFGTVGIATVGNDICLGLGTELVTARHVEGRFPQVDQVIPKKRPLFTFRVDPRTLADTLLAMAELLPEADRAVQCFYYGDNFPIGFCARNPETGMMIDALVVPLAMEKPKAKDAGAKDKDTATKEKAAEPEANGQTPTPAADPRPTSELEAPAPQGEDTKDSAEPKAVTGTDLKDAKKSKRKG